MLRALVLGFCLGSWVASARADALRVDQSAERMRVDGALREWKGARFVQLGSGSDASLRFALASADGGLYVGVELTDERLVRGAGVGEKQDALVLTFSMPDERGGFQASEVWLHAGEPGRTKAAAGLGAPGRTPRAESRVRVVEGPLAEGGGYVLEAFVPWSLIEGAEIWEQGRAALRFEDVDNERASAVETTLSTAQASKASELPRFVLGDGHHDFLGAFLRSQNLVGIEPRHDFRGNVHGDGAPERVVLVDNFALVYGPHYKKGDAFGYVKLPVGTGGGLESAELRELTGDGLSELVLVLRQKNELGARDVWMVVSLSGEDPRPMFSIELRKEAQGGFVESTLSLDRKGRGPTRIRVASGRAQGLDATSYREGKASDAAPILLPWGEVQARTYQYDGARFAVVHEVQRPAAKSATAASRPSGAEPIEVEESITPSTEAVLALFKKEHKLKRSAEPSRHQHANVYAGEQEEHLFVFGSTLLLLGGDLGEGGSYLAYELPASAPSDFLYVGSSDVTGDGVREIFVRVRQPLSGAAGVHRELALVLRFDELGRFGRALAADVTRRQGENVIANRVSTRGGTLVIEPGTSKGWTESNYPFTNEASSGISPLLLPWADAPVRYRLERGALVRVAR